MADVASSTGNKGAVSQHGDEGSHAGVKKAQRQGDSEKKAGDSTVTSIATKEADASKQVASLPEAVSVTTRGMKPTAAAGQQEQRTAQQEHDSAISSSEVAAEEKQTAACDAGVVEVRYGKTDVQVAPEEEGEAKEDEDELLQRLTEIESLCTQCKKNGKTLMLLHRIPHFKDILISSFSCSHCGYTNREVEGVGPLAAHGVRLTLQVADEEDLKRQVVISEFATVLLPDVELEIPPSYAYSNVGGNKRSAVKTVEGIVRDAAEALAEGQEARRAVDPEIAKRIDQLISRLQAFAEGSSYPFLLQLDDPSGNSYIEPLPSPPLLSPSLPSPVATGRDGDAASASRTSSSSSSTSSSSCFSSVPTDKLVSSNTDSSQACAAPSATVILSASGSSAPASNNTAPPSSGGTPASGGGGGRVGVEHLLGEVWLGEEGRDMRLKKEIYTRSREQLHAMGYYEQQQQPQEEEEEKKKRKEKEEGEDEEEGGIIGEQKEGKQKSLGGEDKKEEKSSTLRKGEGGIEGGIEGSAVAAAAEVAAAVRPRVWDLSKPLEESFGCEGDRLNKKVVNKSGSGRTKDTLEEGLLTTSGENNINNRITDVITAADDSAAAAHDAEDVYELDGWSLPVECPHCGVSGNNRVCEIDIPGFRRCLIFAFVCDACGARETEVKPAGAFGVAGRRWILKVETQEDLGRDVLKSDVATICIPSLQLTMQGGTQGGDFTTVEGLLDKLAESLDSTTAFASGDSAPPERRERVLAVTAKLRVLKEGPRGGADAPGKRESAAQYSSHAGGEQSLQQPHKTTDSSTLEANTQQHQQKKGGGAEQQQHHPQKIQQQTQEGGSHSTRRSSSTATTTTTSSSSTSTATTTTTQGHIDEKKAEQETGKTHDVATNTFHPFVLILDDCADTSFIGGRRNHAVSSVLLQQQQEQKHKQKQKQQQQQHDEEKQTGGGGALAEGKEDDERITTDVKCEPVVGDTTLLLAQDKKEMTERKRSGGDRKQQMMPATSGGGDAEKDKQGDEKYEDEQEDDEIMRKKKEEALSDANIAAATEGQILWTERRDSQLFTEIYKRTLEQDDELGLTDMQV